MRLLAILAAVAALSTSATATPPRADQPVVADETRDEHGRAACVPMGRDDTVLVDVRDAPLGDIARLVSCATERNILFSPGELAQRQVTVVSARPIGRRALVALWHTLLAENGLAGERRGAYEVVRTSGR